MSTSEILNRAADLIERYGWTHIKDDPNDNPWGGAGKPMCIEGGILSAMGLEPLDSGLGDENDYILTNCPAYKAVQEYLGNDHRLYRFNDAEGRTAREVIEVLRGAALVESVKESNNVEVKA